MKKAKIIVPLIFILIIALSLTAYFTLRPKGEEGFKAITVTVEFDDVSRKIDLETNAEYLREAIEASEDIIVTGDESEFGLYIKTIDGRTADESIQEWWCLTKNGGEQVNTGIDSTPVIDGDTYEFTLKKGW